MQRLRRPALRGAVLVRWARNVPRWARAFLALDAAHRRARIRRKLHRALGDLAARLTGSTTRMTEPRAADVLDYGASLPAHRRRLVELHLRAYRHYRPSSYAGRVALFRATVRPLFGLHDPADGWRELSSGGIQVIDVPTTHEGMFRQPHVVYVAQMLRGILAAAVGERPRSSARTGRVSG